MDKYFEKIDQFDFELLKGFWSSYDYTLLNFMILSQASFAKVTHVTDALLDLFDFARKGMVRSAIKFVLSEHLPQIEKVQIAVLFYHRSRSAENFHRTQKAIQVDRI